MKKVTMLLLLTVISIKNLKTMDFVIEPIVGDLGIEEEDVIKKLKREKYLAIGILMGAIQPKIRLIMQMIQDAMYITGEKMKKETETAIEGIEIKLKTKIEGAASLKEVERIAKPTFHESLEELEKIKAIVKEKIEAIMKNLEND